MTATFENDLSMERKTAIRIPNNLYQFRKNNLADVTNAISILKDITPKEAEPEAEAFITTAFHEAAMETGWRRKLKRAALAATSAVAAASTALSSVSLIEGLNNRMDNPPIAVLSLAALGASATLYYSYRLEEWFMRNQANDEFGYEPDPGAWGHKRVYRRASRSVEALMANAQRKAHTPTAEAR